MRAIVLGPAALLLPAAGWAHGTELDWHVPPSDSLAVLVPLVALATLYLAGLLRRWRLHGPQPRDAARSACFTLAVVLLAMALVWPLDAWAGLSFTAHMGQHMVLTVLAPPLLLLGRPGPLVLRALPQAARTALVQPRSWPGARAVRTACASVGATAALHGLLLWGWHVPAAFELALRHEAVHWAEHVTLLGSGLLFWRALLRARGAATLWALVQVLLTVVHSGLLGALLTLAPQPLYGHYVRLLGPAAALADQQLAGLLMWIPMGTAYMAAAGLLAAGLLAPPSSPAAARPPARAIRL